VDNRKFMQWAIGDMLYRKWLADRNMSDSSATRVLYRIEHKALNEWVVLLMQIDGTLDEDDIRRLNEE